MGVRRAAGLVFAGLLVIAPGAGCGGSADEGDVHPDLARLRARVEEIRPAVEEALGEPLGGPVVVRPANIHVLGALAMCRALPAPGVLDPAESRGALGWVREGIARRLALSGRGLEALYFACQMPVAPDPAGRTLFVLAEHAEPGRPRKALWEQRGGIDPLLVRGLVEWWAVRRSVPAPPAPGRWSEETAVRLAVRDAIGQRVLIRVAPRLGLPAEAAGPSPLPDLKEVTDLRRRREFARGAAFDLGLPEAARAWLDRAVAEAGERAAMERALGDPHRTLAELLGGERGEPALRAPAWRLAEVLGEHGTRLPLLPIPPLMTRAALSPGAEDKAGLVREGYRVRIPVTDGKALTPDIDAFLFLSATDGEARELCAALVEAEKSTDRDTMASPVPQSILRADWTTFTLRGLPADRVEWLSGGRAFEGTQTAAFVAFGPYCLWLTVDGPHALPLSLSGLASRAVSAVLGDGVAPEREPWEERFAAYAAGGRAGLRQALTDPDPAIRARAVRRLADENHRPGIPWAEYRALLLDPDPAVRVAALGALSGFETEREEFDDLLIDLLDHPDPAVRAEAIARLWNFGDDLPRRATAYAKALADPVGAVRLSAAETVAIGPIPPEVVPGLLRLVAEGVRSPAIFALEQAGPVTAPAIPVLREALASDLPAVREAAAKALRAIDPDDSDLMAEVARVPGKPEDR
ncbi:MAG: HEAT repeat domain-containing protein [Planctomycetes bacterium]|nr:HEAT repeat domain-containing protein [Planctomycetota bacterium]